MQRFLASDVIYSDEFVGPAKEALEKDDITGVEVPTGQPFLPNPALVNTEGAAKTLLPGARSGSGSAGGGGGDSSRQPARHLARLDRGPALRDAPDAGDAARRPGLRPAQVARDRSRTAATSTSRTSS